MSALSNWKALPLDKQANNLTGGKTRIYCHKKVNPKKVAKPSGLRRKREGVGEKRCYTRVAVKLFRINELKAKLNAINQT